MIHDLKTLIKAVAALLQLINTFQQGGNLMVSDFPNEALEALKKWNQSPDSDVEHSDIDEVNKAYITVIKYLALSQEKFNRPKVPKTFLAEIVEEPVLMTAIRLYHSNKDMIYPIKDLLVSPGINVNAKGAGTTVLGKSIKLHQRTVMELLINHPDININQPDDEGFTPLMIAAKECRAYAVKRILAHPSIDVTFRNNDGDTAADVAFMYNHTSEIPELIDDEIKRKSKDHVSSLLRLSITSNVSSSTESGSEPSLKKKDNMNDL